MAGNEKGDCGQVKKDDNVESDMSKPLMGDVLTSFDLTDHRVLTFWLLELVGFLSFVFWLSVGVFLQRVPAVLNFRPNGPVHFFPSFNVSSAGVRAPVPADISNVHDSVSFAKLLSADVWFSLGFMATLDAFAMVANFNRALMSRFHYAVSMRMMLLASAISFGVLLWDKEKTTLISQYPVRSLILGFALYLLSGLFLDKFEKPMPTSGASSHQGTLQQYSEVLSLFDVSWQRALFLATVTGGAGLILTMLVPLQWSSLVPVLHAAFESAFLLAMEAGRTPRYIVLSSPLLQSTFCVHWGWGPVSAAPRLAIAPWTFLTLILTGRLLLDIHLWTIFRSRPELRWARKEVLVSTSKLLGICTAMFLLEKMGLKVITYIKPITMPLFFLLSSAGFLAPAAYIIAFDKNKKVRM